MWLRKGDGGQAFLFLEGESVVVAFSKEVELVADGQELIEVVEILARFFLGPAALGVGCGFGIKLPANSGGPGHIIEVS